MILNKYVKSAFFALAVCLGSVGQSQAQNFGSGCSDDVFWVPGFGGFPGGGACPPRHHHCCDDNPSSQPAPCQTYPTICLKNSQKPGCFCCDAEEGKTGAKQVSGHDIYIAGLESLVANSCHNEGAARLLNQMAFATQDPVAAAKMLSYSAVYGPCCEAMQALQVLGFLMSGGNPGFLGNPGGPSNWSSFCDSINVFPCERIGLDTRLSVATQLVETMMYAESKCWSHQEGNPAIPCVLTQAFKCTRDPRVLQFFSCALSNLKGENCEFKHLIESYYPGICH